MSIITFTTDFGLQDWFVGVMKGVVLGIHPAAQIVDITHAIAPGDIRAGAFALAAAATSFPEGTIHVAVVDPGVGSARRAIAAKTRRAFFVGPDNGLLSLALAQDPPECVSRLENTHYFLPHVSRTFHGRDIFAPVAAHLSHGVPLREFGEELQSWEKLPVAELRRSGRGWEGEVVYVDRFGNGITNVPATAAVGMSVVEVHGKGRCVTVPLVEFYQSVPKGEPLAVIGSAGFIEVAIHGGSAREVWGLVVGDRVVITAG